MATPIVHAAAKWNRRAGTRIVPTCKRYAMTPSDFAVTTEDLSKVTCKACAKSLGIPPAAVEKSATESKSGTCPCCFGTFKVPGSGKRNASLISLHGYTRPGFGWIVGECRGAHKVAFEISCEATKDWRNELENVHLPGHVAELERLNSGTVESLPYRKHVSGYGSKSVFENVQITRGTAQVYGYRSVPSFDQLLASEIRTAQRIIAQIRETVADLDKRIAAWKPAELR